MTFVKTVDTSVIAIVEFANRDYLNHEDYKAREAEKLATALKRCEKMGWNEFGSSIDFDYDEKDDESAEIEREFADRLVALAVANDMRGFRESFAR